MQFQNKTVLVLETSKYLTKILQDRFKEIQVNGVFLADMKQMIRGIVDNNPDMVITEVQEPYTLQQITKLRTVGKVAHLPVVAHTMVVNKQAAIRLLSSGFSDIIAKPSSFDRILKCMAKHLISESAPVEEVHSSLWDRVKSKSKPIEKIQILLREGEELKALPYAVTKAITLTKEDESSANDIARIVRADSVILGTILKKANSAHYGRSRNISDVGEAIVRIGFEETRKILLGMSIMSTMNKETRSLGFSSLGFWEHSLAVSALATRFAQRNPNVDQAQAFVAAMLHDIGKLILDQNLPQEFERAVETAMTRPCMIRDAETEMFGFSHNDLGYAVLKLWNLLNPILMAAFYHNTVDANEIKCDEASRNLVKTISIANNIAKALGFRAAGDDIVHDINMVDAQFIGLPMGIPKDMVEKVYFEVDEFKTFLSISEESSKDILKFKFLPGVEYPPIVYVALGNPPIRLPMMAMEAAQIPFAFEFKMEKFLKERIPGKKPLLILDDYLSENLMELAKALFSIRDELAGVIFLGKPETAAPLTDALKVNDKFMAFPKPISLDSFLRGIYDFLARAEPVPVIPPEGE